MNKFYYKLSVFIFLLTVCAGLRAQVTVTGNTNTTPAMAATYTSLANAITALNSITAISGPVVITLAAGNPQTAPVGGYTINFTATTAAARTVTLTGNNNIITTNSALVSGVLTDAVFKIIGSNFVTIQGFTMQENPLNITSAAATNDMTEWGVALLCASTTNGAQNNTIRSNNISLGRTYSNTFGIYSNARHSATNVTVVADASSAPGANSNNKIYSNVINNINMGIAFIGSGNAGFMDLGNEIGSDAFTGNIVGNWGGMAASSSFVGNSGSCYGIFINNQKNENVSFNFITSASLLGTPVDTRGIFKFYNTVPSGTFGSSITNNSISVDHRFTSGLLQGIRSEGMATTVAGATINITNNLLFDISVSGTGSTTEIIGISNSSSCGVLNINDNIFRNFFSSAATAGFTAIDNNAAISSAVNINNNLMGDGAADIAIRFFTGSQPVLVRGIKNTTAAGTAVTISISGNDFQDFNQDTPAASDYVFIECQHQGTVTSATNINSNTFTNLVTNTSGNVTFIKRTGPMTLNAGITDNCNDNRIVTAYSKPVTGGTVTLYDCASASDGGLLNVMNQLRNNFSNITLTGATIMAGWNNVSGTVNGPTKYINDNVFSNWTCGSGAVKVIQSDLGGNNSTVNDNIISGISAAAPLTAITLGSGNSGIKQSCSGNTISALSSSGGTLLGISGGSASVTTFNISNNVISGLATSTAVSTISGIRMLTASTANVSKNKIFDNSTTNASSTINGMDVAAAAVGTYNISNNMIGNLRADFTSSTNAIRGINLLSANAGTAYNIFYNTVYINAMLGGANFGTSALTATSSATAANGALSLRNNILVNTSLARGTGLTVAYRRSGTTLNNYVANSNNNIFYAGTPSAANLIFADGINNDQTLVAYKARVAARDAASFTEMPPFLSTVGTSPDFLHLDPAAVTQAENGAVNIAGYTDDFDGVIRQGNAGYGGSGTAPDIGADEINGIVVVVTNFNLTTPALAPAYTSLANAITALNTVTSMLNGTVTITLMPGNSQTAPVGGYNITTNAALALTRNIVITGSNNTITTNSHLIAGSVSDAVFKITGSNFITISNFVMRENPLNITTDTTTNDMTEWGVALLRASATNGAQGNIIQNNTISLDKNYSNSFGIYSNARHTATAVGVVSEASSTAGANSNNDIYGNTISNVNFGIAFIGSGNVATMDVGNDIGGASAATANSMSNMGGKAAASSFVSNAEGWYAIFMNHQKGENVSFNNIVSGAIVGLTEVNVRGIYKAYTATAPTGTFTSSINNNTVTLEHVFFQTSQFIGIFTEGIVGASSNATININNNSLLNFTVFTGGTDIVGIANSSELLVLNINNNIFRGNFSSASTGGFTGILNTGTISSTLNINNNKLGDASGNAFTFTGATSGAIKGISCPVTGDDLLLSISGNNFQGFVQNITGSGNHDYISYVHSPTLATTVNINSNTFTNLTARTTGNVTFIARSGVMALNAGVTENCSNNSIVTAFNKPDGNGLVTFYSATSASLSGNTMVQTGNNFSNINFPNFNAIVGWNNSEGEIAFGNGPTKTISSNVFSNWNLGLGKATIMQIIGGASNSSISGNTISTITSTASGNDVLGIYLGNSVQSGILNCSGNTISGISVTVNGNVTGILTESFSNDRNISGNSISGLSTSGFTGTTKAISVKQGSVVNIFRNKIYGLNGTGKIIGIDMPPGLFGTYAIHNNLVGSFSGENVINDNSVRGINIESVEAANNFDIYYNTINLNTNFVDFGAGSSGIYLTGNTNGPVSLRNNIIVNTSTIASGPGLTVALRRSSTDLANYAISSDNNIFYAGIASASNLIYYDGTNSDQSLSTFKTRVGPTRDAGSFTGMPAFLSTVGSSANFLHLDPAIASLSESRAVNIATYTTDYDVNIRQGNAGYVGTGTAPDIGADETAGLFHETAAPVITYTGIASSVCIATPKNITGVTIADATGIPLSGALRPRIYYRKNAGSWFSQPGTNTAGTATSSTWSFTIVETDMGGVALGDVVSYFIVAQDLMPVTNVGTNPVSGTDAVSVNTILIPPTTPKTYTITSSLGGTYTVGSGGNFTTLTAAVNAYNNACSLTAPVVFELISSSYLSESFPITILNHPDAGPARTLTIRPSATGIGAFAAFNDNQLIDLNGARYVTFDGRQDGIGTTGVMSFINTSTLGVAFRFINEAQHNTIKYCDIRSQHKSVTGGTIFFSTTNVSGGTGNDHNTIDNNQIKDPSFGQEPVNAIFSLGTASAGNDSIAITNNRIFNYYHATNSTAGIFASSYNSGWTITGNRLFQDATRLYTAAASHYGIRVTSGAGYTIGNNIIGFSNQGGSGLTNMIGNSVTLAGFPSSYTATGTAVPITYIAISGSFDPGGTVSAIDANTISNIAMYTSSNASTLSGMLCGISVASGKVNISGNTIGSTTISNSIYAATTTTGGTVVGIYTNATGVVAIQNNNIGGITASGTSNTKAAGITAINTEGTADYTISNNFIGNTAAGNIRMGLVLAGASLSNAGTLTSTSGTAVALKGIVNSSTGNTVSITGNTLRGWQTSATETTIRGIESSGTLTGSNPVADISNNFLGTAATGWGSSVVSSTQLAFGIKLHARNQASTNVKHNDFRGIGFSNSAGISCISLSDTTAANNVTSITGNTFTNLAVTAYGLSLIAAYQVLGSNAISNIDSNKTVGTFNFTGSLFGMIGSGFVNGTTALRTTISHNEFTNAVLVFPDDNASSAVIIGAYNSSGEMRIEHNSISNVVQTGAIFYAIAFDYSFGALTDTARVSNNSISNITVAGIGNLGIGSFAGNDFKPVLVSNNSIKNLSLSRATDTTETFVTGIQMYSASSQKGIIVKGNEINSLSSSIDSSIVSGVLIYNFNTSSSAHSHTINANKIYDLSVTKPGARVAGIYSYLYEPQFLFPVGARRVSVYNNIVGDLRAPAAGNTSRPSIAGISIENNRVKDTIDIYHNTIDLRASSSHIAFSSAAVYTDTLARINSYGNIFNNISTPGASGKTVAYWRRGANLTNFDGDYNSLYAGTPATNRLIYFDGTNSNQTLPAYKTRVGAIREVASVTELPAYISLIGNNTGYLHLDPNANCGLIGKALNIYDINELYLDFDKDPRESWYYTHDYVDIGADEVVKPNRWTGATSTSWNDPLNWSLGSVPNGTEMRISIPSGPSNQPVIAVGESYQVRDLVINPGALLTNRGILKIAGDISANAGAINNTNAGVVTGSIEMNTLCDKPMSIKGNIFTGNAVKDFRMFTDFSVSSTAGEGLKVSGLFGFGVDAATVNKTFNSGNNVVLVSTADATASVVKTLSNNIYTGQFTVERFIPARRSWRLLTAPLSSTATTSISQAWQDGQQATTIPPPVYTAGSGALITFSTTAVNGYDKGSTNNPSLKFYNGTGWVAPANTTMPINTHPGYMLFVRGDRNISIAGTGVVANTTTLRPKATINNGLQTIPATGAGFKVIGNPYASTINFHTTIKTGLADQYRLWDPKIGGTAGVGGFVTFSWNSLNNNYDRTVTGIGSTVLPQDGTIQSGAAFVVNFTGAGSLQINETDKVSTSASTPFGRPMQPTSAEGRLSVNLGFHDIDGSLQLLDAVLVTFHAAYNNALDADDAVKMTNVNEDFGINKNDTAIAIERREPIKKNDTVFFKFTQPKVRTYILQLAPMHLAVPGLTAFIEDKYTNTQTQVSLADTSYYSFATSNSAVGSYAADRIRLIFKTTSVDSLVPAFLQLSAKQQNNFIAVDWKISNEQFVEKYEIERSTNGVDFVKLASIAADGNNLYQWMDEQPVQGNNFYRIKKIGTNGEFEYSHVVNARIGKTENWVNIYPNPVTGGNCMIQINNKTAGVYTLRLLSSMGQVIYTSTINHPGGQSSQQLKLPGNITDGEYQVALICIDNGHTDIIPLLIKRKW